MPLIPPDVASFAEAWIENNSSHTGASGTLASPPSRRRGLKNNTYIQGNDDNKVASFAEAWIENMLFLHGYTIN